MSFYENSFPVNTNAFVVDPIYISKAAICYVHVQWVCIFNIKTCIKSEPIHLKVKHNTDPAERIIAHNILKPTHYTRVLHFHCGMYTILHAYLGHIDINFSRWNWKKSPYLRVVRAVSYTIDCWTEIHGYLTISKRSCHQAGISSKRCDAKPYLMLMDLAKTLKYSDINLSHMRCMW